MNPNYMFNRKSWMINDLIFKGEDALKQSSLIKSIILVPDSLADERNKRGWLQYKRYVHQAQFSNYPQMALSNCLGLTNKGEAQITLPEKMTSLIDYATKENTDLSKLQDEVITSLFKFGLAGIKVDIANDASTEEPPRLKVIEGIDIVDGQSERIGNIDLFKWILIDATKQIFNPDTKNYQVKKLFKVLGLDQDGNYYEALIEQIQWPTFDILHPDKSQNIELVYPSFFNTLDFIPFVAVNNETCELKWGTSFIQNLIDTSLSIFQLEADLRMGLHMQSNGSLFIYGSNMKPSEVIQGMYACNIFKDTAAKGEYVTPNVAGMQAQMAKLDGMKEEAIQQIFSIINVSDGASGDALALRIQSSTTSLIALVKNVGNAITRVLEMIGTLMGYSEDVIDYQPYLGFAEIKSGEDAKEEIIEDPPEVIEEEIE